MRRRITTIYISIMLLIFPLFPGFSGYANITFSKYAFFLIFTGLWLAALLCLSLGRKSKMPKLGTQHYAAIAFGLICLLSWLFSPHRSESLIGAGRYDGLVTQLLYVCIFLGVSLFGEVRKSHFVCLGVSALLCSTIGVVQLFNIDILSLFPGDYSHYDGGIRYSGAFLGTMGNTNVLSAYYCLALPMLFVLPMLWKSRLAWLSLAPLCLSLFVMIRAGVSGGFVGLGFGVLAASPLLISSLRRLRCALISAAACLCAATAALAFAPQYSLDAGFAWSFRFGALPITALVAAVFCALAAGVLVKVKSNPSEKKLRRIVAILCLAALLLALIFIYFSPATDGTLYELSQVMHGNLDEKFGSSRILIWRECLALFTERPLLGGGPDSLALRVDVQFSRFVEETGNTLRSGVDNAHNEYIGYLINTGILGLAAYLFLLCLGLRSWLKNLRRSVLCALGPGLLCYCAQSFFALGLPLVSPMFWICLALLFAPGSPVHKQISPAPSDVM